MHFPPHGCPRLPSRGSEQGVGAGAGPAVPMPITEPLCPAAPLLTQRFPRAPPWEPRDHRRGDPARGRAGGEGGHSSGERQPQPQSLRGGPGTEGTL